MDVRIFLSSTFEDLVDTRERIRQHLSVIPAEIVRMEMFGSDETRPVEFCLEQLRTCNFFVGVYAERYGSVEPKTGASVVELEYHEAHKLLASGQLTALLVYMLNPKASWPVNLIERDPSKAASLTRLKEAITAAHTVTFFDDLEKLSLDVLRDVLRKIGINPDNMPRARVLPIAPVSKEARVVGMEHYTERDAAYLRGRDEAVAGLMKLVRDHPVIVLVGDSGVGKTSLLHAGLVPALKKEGWAVAITRPLDNPDLRIAEGLWQQLMETPYRTNTTLGTALGFVSLAHVDRPVFIAIDQFEDAIPLLGQPSTDDLLTALTRTYSIPLPNIKLLISYRGDTDAKVGPHWQRISGSPNGLPHYYLEPLSARAAQQVLSDLLSSHIEPSDTQQLISAITTDLEEESSTIEIVGIYPPFLQMVIETLTKQAELNKVLPSTTLYKTLNGAHEIIGRYLINQLRFLGDRELEARRILPELVSKTGRLRRTAEELARGTGLATEIITSILQHLSALRIARCQDDTWEIVHDFLARRIWEEFSNPEEQDARTFGELLRAKTVTFPTTGELLTIRELIGVYAHRQLIKCSQEETELIFASALRWNGPYRYYLANTPAEVESYWAQKHVTSEDDPLAQNAYRVILANNYRVSLERLVKAFSDFKLQGELATLIRGHAQRADLGLLLDLRNRRRELVADAARDALRKLLAPSDYEALSRLLRSQKYLDRALVCRLLSENSAINLIAPDIPATKAVWRRVRKLAALCSHEGQDTPAFRETVRKGLRSPSHSVAASAAFGAVLRTTGVKERGVIAEKLLKSRSLSVKYGALAAIETTNIEIDMSVLLETCARLPWETSRVALAAAGPKHFDTLREFVREREIEPPDRDLLIALAKSGGASGASYVIELVRTAKHRIYVWNVPWFAESLSRYCDRSLLPRLRSFVSVAEFWRFARRTDKAIGRLPVQTGDNLHLFRRIVGICLAAISSESEWDILKRLACHKYVTIRMAAARQIAMFATVEHLEALISEFRTDANFEDLDAIRLVDEAVYRRSAHPIDGTHLGSQALCHSSQ